MGDLIDEVPHWSEAQREALARAVALAAYADFETDEDEEIEIGLAGADLGLSIELDEALDWARDLANDDLQDAVRDVCEGLPVEHHDAVFTILMGVTLADMHQNPDETYVMKQFARFLHLEEK